MEYNHLTAFSDKDPAFPVRYWYKPKPFSDTIFNFVLWNENCIIYWHNVLAEVNTFENSFAESKMI